METIYHITHLREWSSAIEMGYYTSPSLTEEGFIHCSYRSQVADTANRYYAGMHGLVLLAVDPERLSCRVLVEPSTSGELFPHVYGRIEINSVKQVMPFEPDTDGCFVFPQELE